MNKYPSADRPGTGADPAWHESAYQALKAEAATGDRTFAYLGRLPVIGCTPSPRHARPTGCWTWPPPPPGEVLAVDINPYAVAAARGNAGRNGVADR
jgi:hypothetical protein